MVVTNVIVVKKSTLFAGILFLCASCSKPLPDIGMYRSLSRYVSDGFAIDKAHIAPVEGKVVKVWGYLDPYNIFLHDRLFADQDRLWDNKKNSFFLKARKEDAVGDGVEVYLEGDMRQYRKVYAHFREAGEKSLKVLVRGRVETHPCPTNFTMSYCVMLHVTSAKDIQFTK